MSEPAASDPSVGPPSSSPLGPVAPPTPPSGQPKASRRKKRSATRNAVEWIIIIVAALLVALVIKTFLFQAFYIPSESMEPTLKPGDRVLVNKLSYDLHSIHRGDIVVFKRPPLEAGNPAIKDLIKRVVGLPGETIQAKSGQVYINGRPLNESYLPAGTVTSNLDVPRFIKPGQYFVMGDNRSNSSDSRYIGPIPGSLIVGRAFIRVWPLSSIDLL